ncbi:hypothetical protein IFM89_020585, partial [Coptis chinensis]
RFNFISFVNDDIVARIEDRISGWIFLPKENSEAVQIMHYVHEDTRECLDYYCDKARLGFDESLMATVVLYLSNVSHGGETLFRKPEAIFLQIMESYGILYKEDWSMLKYHRKLKLIQRGILWDLIERRSGKELENEFKFLNNGDAGFVEIAQAMLTSHLFS